MPSSGERAYNNRFLFTLNPLHKHVKYSDRHANYTKTLSYYTKICITIIYFFLFPNKSMYV